MLEKKNILGVGITDATKEEILEFIIRGLEKSQEKYFIVTPNPEILATANNNAEYKNVLNKAKIALADGIGVVLASRFLGRELKGRTTGTDLLQSICKEVAEKPITVGFLGGGPKIAETTAECLRLKYPGLKVVFVHEEWPNKLIARQPRVSGDVRMQNSKNKSLDSSSLSKSRLQSGTKPTFSSPESGLPRSLESIDILFVAFGAPKQEIWISENLENLPVKIAIGVGGAFDYISGKVPRAPLWIRKIGLEWLFRLIRQPWRIKRQMSLLKFIWLVLKEKVGIG